MPKGVYKHNKKQGFQKNHSVWNKGVASPMKGKKRPEFAGENHPNFGKKYSLSNIAIDKIKKSKTGEKNPMYKKPSAMGMLGKKHSIDTRKAMSNAHKLKVARGVHHRLKGGITPENYAIRHSIEMRLWRESVFSRDNYTCQKTGIKGGYIVAHHIKNFSQFPELRTSIENGITLSKQAHQDFHKKYGNQNNTPEQLKEFLKK